MLDLNLGLAETSELSRFYVATPFQRMRQLNPVAKNCLSCTKVFQAEDEWLSGRMQYVPTAIFLLQLYPMIVEVVVAYCIRHGDLAMQIETLIPFQRTRQ